MELLVQMWCPFQDSPMDRALYIWGCSNADCQGKQGSVRAWRGLRFNAKYAQELEKKAAKEKAKEAAKKKAEKEAVQKATQANPFSTLNSATPNPFGFGNQIFGKATATPQNSNTEKDEENEESEHESDIESSDAESLVVALASTRLAESPWASVPSHPPLYLSTVSEYIPAHPSSSSQREESSTAITTSSSDGWSEVYENSMNLDQVFERFTKRVGYEGEQCVRYDLGGVPLPFSSDSTFQSLFPTSADGRRAYTPSAVPLCSHCKSLRVFECQLMPNLINVIRSPSSMADLTDEERRKLVEKEMKEKGTKGLDWGTCLVFSCEKDCRQGEGSQEIEECWREEVVIIQKDE